MQLMIEQHETDTSEQLGAQKTTLQQLHLQEMQAVELRYRETMANTVSLTREEERVLATEKRKEAVKEAVFTTRKETKSTVTAALTAQHALSMQLAVDDASTTSATQAALVARNEEKDFLNVGTSTGDSQPVREPMISSPTRSPRSRNPPGILSMISSARAFA